MAMQFMCDYNIKYDDERKNEKITKKCLGSSQSERERVRENEAMKMKERKEIIWELAPKTGRFTFYFHSSYSSSSTSSFGSLNSHQT